MHFRASVNKQLAQAPEPRSSSHANSTARLGLPLRMSLGRGLCPASSVSLPRPDIIQCGTPRIERCCRIGNNLGSTWMQLIVSP